MKSKKARLSLIIRLHRHYSRKYSWPVLCKKYLLSREYVRYHTDDNFREKIIENADKWNKENPEKFYQNVRKSQKKHQLKNK